MYIDWLDWPGQPDVAPVADSHTLPVRDTVTILMVAVLNSSQQKLEIKDILRRVSRGGVVIYSMEWLSIPILRRWVYICTRFHGSEWISVLSWLGVFLCNRFMAWSESLHQAFHGIEWICAPCFIVWSVSLRHVSWSGVNLCTSIHGVEWISASDFIEGIESLPQVAWRTSMYQVWWWGNTLCACSMAQNQTNIWSSSWIYQRKSKSSPLSNYNPCWNCSMKKISHQKISSYFPFNIYLIICG